MKRWVVLFILVFILALMTACANTQKTDEDSSEESKSDGMMSEESKSDDDSSEGSKSDAMKAKGFSLMNLEGETVALDDLSGQNVYVKFWASWCSICLAGLDELNALSAQDDDFKVITIVSPDSNGEKSADAFKEWFAGLGYENIEVLLDEDGKVAKEYGVRGYPTSAYIDSEGNLLKILPGHVSNDAVVKGFE